MVRPRKRPQPRRTGPGDRHTPTLWLIIGVLTLLQAVAMVGLWPHGEDRPLKKRADAYQGVSFFSGPIVGLSQGSCAGDMSDRQADGTIPKTTTCYRADVKIRDNGATRTVQVGIPPQVARSGIKLGNKIQVSRYPAIDGQPPVYGYIDFARRPPMLLLASIFLVAVFIVGRWRGLLAIAGLLLAYVTLAVFVLPALLAGRNAVLVGAVSAGLIMTVILYLVHGLSDKTTTALLGTLSGIWVTAGLAWWISGAAHLNGLVSEENYALSRLTTTADIRAVILCGMILAGLGILNDVTITQASAVWEMRSLAGDLTGRRLFTSAMQIGRDHMASTIYTIAFAYAGVALPGLLLVDLYGQPLSQLLTSGAVAEEIARTLVASIGLILAIPLTTAIGVGLSRNTAPMSWPTRTSPARSGQGREPIRPQDEPVKRGRSDFPV